MTAEDAGAAISASFVADPGADRVGMVAAGGSGVGFGNAPTVAKTPLAPCFPPCHHTTAAMTSRTPSALNHTLAGRIFMGRKPNGN